MAPASTPRQRAAPLDAPRTVSVGGLTIRYRDRGVGAPVLLVHGGASDASTWNAFAAALHAHGYRTIAPDLRGHGGTSRTPRYPLDGFADDLLGLLDALALERVTVVAHSLGAYAAAVAASRAPDRIHTLVLEEPPSPLPTDAPSSQLPPLAAFLLLAAGSVLRRRRFDASGMTEVIRQLRAPAATYWDDLPTIAARTLVISGGPKSHVPADGIAAMAARIPNATLATIPVGHRIHSRAPDRFRDLVLPFLGPAPTA